MSQLQTINKLRGRLTVAAAAALVLTGCGASSPAPAAPGTGSIGSNQATNNQVANQTSNQAANPSPAAGATAPSGSNPAQPAQPSGKQYANPPAMTIDPNKGYIATINTTDGSFQVQLLPKDAPITVNNFVFLANDHFYDHIKFHRIIQSFMIQTGDPKGDGTGGPGYTIKDELPPRIPYAPGIVAMARTSAPNSAGSQFFVCTGPDSQTLQPSYTIFGKVTSGMDVVNKIAATPVGVNPMTGEPSVPQQDVRINSISIQVTPGG